MCNSVASIIFHIVVQPSSPRRYRTFQLPTLKLCLHSTMTPHCLLHQLLATTLLPLWMWLLSVPHVSGVTQYLPFCTWLISLSIMFSRFIHIVTSITSLLIFKCEYSTAWKPILSIYQWTPGLFPPFSSYKYCCNEHWYTSICLGPCFQFYWVYP